MARFADVTETASWMGLEGRPALAARTERRRGRPPRLTAVVPLYRSERHVEACIESLLSYMPADCDVIAVDDGSPDASGRIAREVLAGEPRGLVVALSGNTGYPHATNVGARYARGRNEDRRRKTEQNHGMAFFGLRSSIFVPAFCLLLFNADAVATPGFLGPMLEAMESDPAVAVVGNRHLAPDGSVQSEGSEFSREAGSYVHVGRDVADPIAGEGVKPRDMVTFACALVRANVWRELGGLDEQYVRAYFEDADFCMRVRAIGLRVLYTPRSTIVHVGGHSGGCTTREFRANGRLFARRWVETGLVDRFREERMAALPNHQDTRTP
jgi:GT2 family glycosyltransferase